MCMGSADPVAAIAPGDGRLGRRGADWVRTEVGTGYRFAGDPP